MEHSVPALAAPIPLPPALIALELEAARSFAELEKSAATKGLSFRLGDLSALVPRPPCVPSAGYHRHRVPAFLAAEAKTGTRASTIGRRPLRSDTRTDWLASNHRRPPNRCAPSCVASAAPSAPRPSGTLPQRPSW
jgi:hypothetical protein